MYNFKITWQGTITDTKFTEEIEADTLVEAVNEFYSTYKHEVEIVKIKRCKIKSVTSADYNLGVIVGTDELKEYLNTHSNEIERIYNLEVDYQLPLLYDRLDIPLTLSTNITNESADDLFIKVQLENTTSAQVYSNDSRVMLEINGCDTDNEYEVSNNYFEFTHEEFKKFAQIVQTMKESLEL